MKRSTSKLRVAILEVGAGANVTTVRGTSETCLDEVHDAGADARLIRVNPAYPLAGQNSQEGLTISVMARGLESIRKIDAAMNSRICH
mmetsp:Transcript_30028/g.82420  ORF Transcript_30028/g.82420 Transcript_30028/m.82420 type:complete len:88 (+) Transcript_30028:1146-1409(+)